MSSDDGYDNKCRLALKGEGKPLRDTIESTLLHILCLGDKKQNRLYIKFNTKFMRFLSLAVRLKCQIVQTDDKIHRTMVFLTIVEIMILTLLFMLSNNAFAQAQTLHNQTLYEVVKQTSGLDENVQIDVGDEPVTIAYNPSTKRLYVLNSF
jgi:hypothetical protein